jgi:hypothetical protein
LNILATSGALLVQRYGTSTPAILVGVTRTSHHAVAHIAFNRSGFRWNRVGTIALIAILGASNRESFARAEINTGFDRHRLRVGAGACEFARVYAVRATSNVRPFLGLGEVGKVGLWCANGIGNGTPGGFCNGVLGPGLNGITAWKCVQGAAGLLVN